MHIQAKVLRWGNSYGLRIKKADLERAGLRAGVTIEIDLPTWSEAIDVDAIPAWDLGGGDLDQAFGEGAWKDLASTGR